MLENYKDGQPIFYNITTNAILNNKISHAYIFDSNGNSLVMEMVMSFVKQIICMDIKQDDIKENIYKKIDDGNYIDVKIIRPDGMWIKKDQLLDLQNEFNNKAFEGGKKVYIIKSAEKMNVQTANSILKFLEEPIDDIVAILITDNINLLLPTIVSRCQVIKLNKKKYSSNIFDYLSDLIDINNVKDISNEIEKEMIDNIIQFIKYIEYYNLSTLIYTKKLWHKNFKERSECYIAFDLMIKFYYDVLRYKLNLKSLLFSDFIEIIKDISNNNDITKICNKIGLLDSAMYNIKYNLNINLLIDKLIIDMCGDN